MVPIQKKFEKEGDKKKVITVEVKKEIIENHKQGMSADIARFYNKSD